MEDNNERKVILKFPDSNRIKFEFLLSINEARQSGFLFNVMNCKEEHNYIIDVPSKLYLKTRDIDLKKLYLLWIGAEELPISINYNTVHNYKRIYDLANAFLLNEELPFVKKLSELYGNDIN